MPLTRPCGAALSPGWARALIHPETTPDRCKVSTTMPIAPLLLLALVAQPALPKDLPGRLKAIEAKSQGKLGVAVITPKESLYLHQNERFSLQSVMKLMVSMAALDLVDQGKWKLDQKFTFTRADLSLGAQTLLDKLGKKDSITVTVADCIEYTVTESCSASGDFLARKMGGIQKVNEFLRKHQIKGMSVDRQERDLQTNLDGLTWRAGFTDPTKLDAAVAKVSPTKRDAAYKAYQRDPRDTTTPAAMGDLLEKLVTGKLLSPSSTKYLIGVMERTVTGTDRLAAGVPKGWKLAHKTGTSSTHKGVACATNDVGFVRIAKGEWVILVALLRDSTLKPAGRDGVLRQVAAATLGKK